MDIKGLAKIAKGTKRKKRDTNDLEVAEEINSFYKEYKSLSKVANIVKLSSEMVRQIKSLITLEDEVKRLYRDGILKGYDIGYRISKLAKKDQAILARYVEDKRLSSGDVRAIVRYRIDNPKMSIEEVVNRVLQSKDKKVYVAYLEIEEDTYKKLLERNRTDIVESIFNNLLPKNFIVSFEINGRVVIVKAEREGLQKMRDKAKGLKVPLAKLAGALAREHLEDNK